MSVHWTNNVVDHLVNIYNVYLSSLGIKILP